MKGQNSIAPNPNGLEIATPRVAIIVPAFNESASIQHVLEELNRNNPGNWDIIVINDHSHDNTSNVANEHAEIILDLPINLGIGGCVQSGFLYALRNGYDFAVQFDSDGQHVASEVKTLLWAMDESGADVVIGSRFIDNFSGQFRSSFLRRLGIRIIGISAKLLTGSSIKDPTSGFRAFNKKAIELFAFQYPVHYPEPESLIHLHQNNLRVHEVSTLMSPRKGGRSSLHKKAAFYMVNVMLGMFVSAIRPRNQSNDSGV
jgi:glycosyltransferase involved in cell wall biosynthesis